MSGILASAPAAVDLPLALTFPFVALLACLALCPLLTPKFWERYYRVVACGLGAVSLLWYVAAYHAKDRVVGVAGDYISFIVFLGALYTVAGSIHIRVRGEATPLVNCLYLLAGAIISNLIGTTGASMLLVRPWIRMNKYRFTNFHTAFFIFLISNVGGSLTPIGDPPLFLGYLKGVPFFWITARTWPMWSSAVGLLILIFYFVDRHNFLRAPKEIRELETAHETFLVDGVRNFAYLAIILAAVVFCPVVWRELLMGAAAAASYLTTRPSTHEANHFSFGPIKEVAWIFAGIFATMSPALDYLELHAAAFGLREPAQFYWLSGSLSAVLDNAPTYLTFLAAAFGVHGMMLDEPGQMTAFISQHGEYIVAISLGSVFFGAMTYIGNGPNFMVKAIADHAKVHTPDFFAYILKFSAPILLPVLGLIALIFLRH